MKKILVSTILIGLLTVAGSAFAGTNTSSFTPNNGKDQSSISNGKESNKYSFTLFNFFNEKEDKSKTDSTATEAKLLDPVVKKPIK